MLQALNILSSAQESPLGVVVVFGTTGSNVTTPALRGKQLLYAARQELGGQNFNNLQIFTDKQHPETKLWIVKGHIPQQENTLDTPYDAQDQ